MHLINKEIKEGINLPNTKTMIKNVNLNYLDRPKNKLGKYTNIKI